MDLGEVRGSSEIKRNCSWHHRQSVEVNVDLFCELEGKDNQDLTRTAQKVL